MLSYYNAIRIRQVFYKFTHLLFLFKTFHYFAIHNALVRSELDKFLSGLNFDMKFQQNRKLLFHAPAGIGLVNLWNDFRKVVKFIDENTWVKPMLERIVENKENRGMR